MGLNCHVANSASTIPDVATISLVQPRPKPTTANKATINHNILADENTAALDHHVPDQSPLFTVDLGLGGEADHLCVPGSFHRAGVFHVQGDGACCPANRKITAQLPMMGIGRDDFGTLEGHG